MISANSDLKHIAYINTYFSLKWKNAPNLVCLNVLNTYFISLFSTNINLKYTDYFSTYFSSKMRGFTKFGMFKCIEYLFYLVIQHKYQFGIC